MPRSKYFNIKARDLNFIGDLDKQLYEVLSRASNEELSIILHGGGYATYQTWGKVLQAILKRVCIERNYDPWTKKPLDNICECGHTKDWHENEYIRQNQWAENCHYYFKPTQNTSGGKCSCSQFRPKRLY